MSFPMTQIGGYDISRLIIGTNTFHGYSHFSMARDQWLRSYFTPERIYEVLEFAAKQGLNATVALQNPGYAELLAEVERSTGQHIHYIATPGGATLDELKQGIKQAADLGCEFCWPHTSWTDPRVLPFEGRIHEGPEAVEYIRECGMVAGWSTHRPETVTVSDKAGYDIGGYIQILNPIGFLCQVETDWSARVIREAKHPVVSIKPLGAGRVLPPTGLGFVYENIKPVDTVCIGMLSVEEAREDIEIARACIDRRDAAIELQRTRSKDVLKV
ncbi:MAG: hypothetical protein GF320_09125 [Armatimonadia bacterium]|nr:hypothetical protein [Armatimonadia bacterium]